MDNNASAVTMAKFHSLVLENRKKLVLMGIEAVECFNEREVVLKLNDGMLCVTGNELNVEKLDVEDGSLTILGEVSGIKYSKTVQKVNFFRKVFK